MSNKHVKLSARKKKPTGCCTKIKVFVYTQVIGSFTNMEVFYQIYVIRTKRYGDNDPMSVNDTDYVKL